MIVGTMMTMMTDVTMMAKVTRMISLSTGTRMTG